MNAKGSPESERSLVKSATLETIASSGTAKPVFTDRNGLAAISPGWGVRTFLSGVWTTHGALRLARWLKTSPNRCVVSCASPLAWQPHRSSPGHHTKHWKRLFLPGL